MFPKPPVINFQVYKNPVQMVLDLCACLYWRKVHAFVNILCQMSSSNFVMMFTYKISECFKAHVQYELFVIADKMYFTNRSRSC